jgi:hypothetical protein
VENHGFVIAPIVVRSVNQHDTTLLPDGIDALTDFASLISLDLTGSYLTLDSGFWSEYNQILIRRHGMIPVIKPNRGATKNEKKIELMYANFNEPIYKLRFTVERTFAWQDVYRRVATSYDRLETTRLGFKYLAYSMINLRCFV